MFLGLVLFKSKIKILAFNLVLYNDLCLITSSLRVITPNLFFEKCHFFATKLNKLINNLNYNCFKKYECQFHYKCFRKCRSIYNLLSWRTKVVCIKFLKN